MTASMTSSPDVVVPSSIVTALNGGNQCSHLEVDSQELEFPFAHIYQLQADLQTRLQTYMNPDGDKRRLATRLLFWRQCIADELAEIEEHAPFDTEALQKEAAFEIIDAMHFIFNIGLELGITSGQIQAASEIFILGAAQLHCTTHYQYSYELQRDLSALINCFPWKTWKTYSDETIALTTATDQTFPSYCRILSRTFAFAEYFGLNPKQVVEYYISKNQHNHKRQDDGY